MVLNSRAAKSDSAPSRGHPSQKGIAPPGSVLAVFFSPVLRTIAGAASGAARKKTATRYAARLGGSSRTIRGAGRICKPGVSERNMQMP